MEHSKENKAIAILVVCAIIIVGVASWIAIRNEVVDVTPHVHIKAKVYFNNLKYYNSTYCLTQSSDPESYVVIDGKHVETSYTVIIR